MYKVESPSYNLTYIEAASYTYKVRIEIRTELHTPKLKPTSYTIIGKD